VSSAINSGRLDNQPIVPVREAYRLWSRVYDSQPNPMIALEERHLEALLPDLRGRRIVDAGCGTGRWLSRLTGRDAKELLGIDSSPEMLDRATARHTGAKLLLGSCERLPLRNAIADVVLSSFVIGYLDSLPRFAAELRRIVRPGGLLLISDLHPVTAVRKGWQRSFSSQQGRVVVQSRFWSLSAVVKAMEIEGFHMTALVEPCFGDHEFRFFEASGKRELFQDLAGQPAIAILAFKL
jgi:malonyl-CoA O-methyltransferase